MLTLSLPKGKDLHLAAKCRSLASLGMTSFRELGPDFRLRPRTPLGV